MSIWALVPQKAIEESKRRLAPLLTDEARGRLARFMLGDVLAMLRAVRGLAGIAVVTPDRALVPSDALAITDTGGGLNGALEHGAAALRSTGARAVLVMPGDVPLVDAAEIELIIEAARRSTVVIVPDRRRVGTNAMALPLPAPIPFHFGAGSFERHVAGARCAGLVPAILPLPGLGFDIDHPRDVGELARAWPRRYGAFLPCLKAAS